MPKIQHLERFDQERIDVQCLVCYWKGKWEETASKVSEANLVMMIAGVSPNRCLCPNCPDGQGYLVASEELKSDDFWEIRPGLKEKIAKLRKASKPVSPCP